MVEITDNVYDIAGINTNIRKTFLNSEKIAIICEFINMNGPRNERFSIVN
mgnify:CR=1 FL=1